MVQPPPRPPATAGAGTDAGGDGGDSLFVDALRAAIGARGASLESLRQSLLERGSSVSVATLSYWRSGRSRPDRGGSMVALADLEQVLCVPSGFLTGKVNPRGPGSAVASGLPSHYVAGSEASDLGDAELSDAQIDAALGELGLSWDDGLRRVSYHDRLDIRPDGTDGAHDVRTVFVASRDGIDRFPVWYGHDDTAAFPFVAGVSNCRLGRAIEFRRFHAVAAEMLLDRPLDTGESAIVEHRMESVGQTTPMHTLRREVWAPLRELAMEVRFPPERCPGRATLRRVVEGAQVAVPVPVVGGGLRLLEIDPQPGIYGFEWDW